MPCKFPIEKIPPIVRACGFKRGGIDSLVFMKKRFIAGDPPLNLCDAPVTDYCNISEWINAIDNCYVRIINQLKGAKPEAQFTTARSAYLCQTPFIISGEKSIDIVDYNYSYSELDTEFWNCLMQYPREFRFAYINCQRQFYGFKDFNLQISQILEDNISGLSYFSGRVNYAGYKLEKPITLPTNIIDLLLNKMNFDCANQQYLQDFTPSCE